jgi:hypothetical protein
VAHKFPANTCMENLFLFLEKKKKKKKKILDDNVVKVRSHVSKVRFDFNQSPKL